MSPVQSASALAQMKSLKLHVGCANIRLEGYVNIDCRKTEATDIVAPAWNIAGVDPASVSSIYSRHMLEHLDPEDARKALKHWLTLLTPGGMLNVIVPDIEFHAQQLIGLKKSHFPDQVQHAFAAFWGWRDVARGGSREDAHRWGYTQSTLTDELQNTGFIGIHRLTSGPDTEPWHLNLTAQKHKTDNCGVLG
nr:methyltransferase domain-containing protein [uncultured Comamonas sp.]